MWPGVYAVGHPRVTRLGRARAAVLTCGPSAMLSHRSAAWMWNLLPDNRWIFDVTVAGRSNLRRESIRLHQPRCLHPDDCAEVDGIAVTSVAKTLFDVAASEPNRHALRAFEEAERLRIFDLREMQHVIERNRGHRRRKQAAALIASWNGHAPDTRGEFERRFLELCRDYDIPEPAMNVMVAGHCVDAHWPGTKAVVELDSWQHHSTREAFEDDRRRDAALREEGFEPPLRVTWRWLTEEPAGVAAAVRKLLQLA